MLQFGYELSRIAVEAKLDADGNFTHLRYQWEGASPYMACTFDLINDLNPQFCECPRLLELKPGSIAKMRPMVFEVEKVIDEYEIVIFKRVQDEELPEGVCDSEGWIEAIK